MMRRTEPIEQSGVIPYRIRNGQLQIALVTVRGGRGWTIPKGHVEPDLSPQKSAAKEASEEAGLIGPVTTRRVGSYAYVKAGAWRLVSVYGMRVRKTLERWPEMHERQRRWMSPEQAAARVRNAELRCCLQQFASRLHERCALAA